MAKSLVERRPLWFTPNAYSQPPPVRYEEPPPKWQKLGGPERQPIFPPAITVVTQAPDAPPQYEPSAPSRDKASAKVRRLASSAVIKGKTVQLCRACNQSSCDKADCKYAHRCSLVVGTRADGSEIVCVSAHPACKHGAGRAKSKGKGKGKLDPPVVSREGDRDDAPVPPSYFEKCSSKITATVERSEERR